MQNIIDTIFIDRDQAQKDVERESKEADLKQHADKLMRGFENIDNNSANRAIWELVQNACDLSPECKIEIDFSNNGFAFSHNGKPFTTSTLISLIKQVSNKTEGNEVGKFGTGFITTHAFGRKFKINSLLYVGGKFISIKDFEIDRSPKESLEMVKKLINQEIQVFELIKHGELVCGQEIKTTFTYLPETLTEQDHIKEALINLHDYIPLVLTLNERLFSVTVIEGNGEVKTYFKQNKELINGRYITKIKIKDELIKVYSLRNEVEEIEVILPLGNDNQAISFSKNIARLFLHFPLIGTEHWGCNFIIHCAKFSPTEPRDGIHLSSKTDQVQDNENDNRDLIQKASKMIFDFLDINASRINFPINLAPLNFNVNSDKPLLNEYFLSLKTLWIEEFKNYPLVETDAGNIKPSEAIFLDDELLLDDSSFDAIFNLANQFWKNIPKRHFIKDWTLIINEWSIESIKYIDIKDIIVKIQEIGNLKDFANANNLKQFYSYLIKHGHSEVFNSYKLLPNIKGVFRQLSGNNGLNSSLNLPVELIEIAEILMPDIPERYVNPDFKFTLDFTDFTRKNFSSEINDHIAKILHEKIISKNLNDSYLKKLIEYCKISTTSDSLSVPTKMIKLICKYYQQSDLLLVLPAVKDDVLDNRSVQDRLLKMFLNDISNSDTIWVAENLIFIKDIISTGHDYSDYEKIFQTTPVFPNQLNELCEQSYLSIDYNISAEIKDLYDKVVTPNLPIRASLVHFSFNKYLKNQQKKTTRNLTEQIESKFFDDNRQFSINNHPFKNEILEIIAELKKSDEYEIIFPLLFSKRSGILVDLAESEDTFAILSLDAKTITKLAELGNNKDFDEIVKLGKEALEGQYQENANFQHKYAIGTHIEKILRRALTSIMPENVNAEIQNVQDGQDIIILINGAPVYYIEVKSRWDVNSPIRMSKNQTLKADQQKDNYVLCSVDMTKYKGEKKFEIENIEVIEHCIKFNIDIGYKVKHLISVLNQTNEPETIHLHGEYRTSIPMKIIEEGIDLLEFENFLIDFVNNKHAIEN